MIDQATANVRSDIEAAMHTRTVDGGMRLYSFPWGPYPQRISNFLAEKGIGALNLTEVEFSHRTDLCAPNFLLDLNPAYSLPVLEDGAGCGPSV